LNAAAIIPFFGRRSSANNTDTVQEGGLLRQRHRRHIIHCVKSDDAKNSKQQQLVLYTCKLFLNELN
jgi:hypothetical protein